MRLSLSLVGLLLVGALAGCSNQSYQGSQPASPAPLLSHRIYAVSYPLQFLTQQIAGDEFEVLVPFTETANPRTDRPTRATIEAMQESDLIIANGTGASYANWLAVVSLSDSKIVNTASRGLALSEYIAIKGNSVVHSHGPEGEHSHPVMAARTWLDPSLAKKQAIYIATRLKQVYPDRADQFDARLERLQTQLDELVAGMERLKQQGNQRESKSTIVLALGSEFEFFVRAAGFTAQPLPLISEGKISDAQLLVSLQSRFERIESSGAEEGEDVEKPQLFLCNPKLAAQEDLSKLCLSFGVQPVAIDLLDQPPLAGDYLSIMKSNITRVEEALR